MTIELFWSDKTKAPAKAEQFKKFAQQMANRLIFGVFRYDKGKPRNGAKYLTRLKAELKEYELNGNIEHLINVANYCMLESVAPENPKSHFKHESRSVTRNKLGMRLDLD